MLLIRLGTTTELTCVFSHSYIPNPFRATLGILAVRSFSEQNEPIRTMIYKYLEADTDIGLTSCSVSTHTQTG